MPRMTVTRLLMAVVLVAAGGWLLADLGRVGPPAWDESAHAMHALRTADRIWHGDATGLVDHLQAQDIYPPLGRAGMALGLLVFGTDWSAPRTATVLAWIATVWLATRIARRLVPPERGDAAALATAVFGLTGWLCIAFASVAMLEAWSSLAAAATVLAVLRAAERGGWRAPLVAGLLLGATFLVKYNNGLILLAALIGSYAWSAIQRLWGARSDAPGERLGPMAWTAAGFALVMAWWFVLPLPLGLERGADHRAGITAFATISGTVPGQTALDLLPLFALAACISLPAAALQVAGMAWGFANLRRPAPRLCITVAFAGFSAFVVYPHREDRFLVPTLFPCWALGAAVTTSLGAWLVARIGAGPLTVRRALVGAGMLAVVLLTRGLGSRAVLAAVQGTPSEMAKAFHERLARRWSEPWQAFKRRDGAPPDSKQLIVQAAAEHLVARESFAWLGGTVTEIPLSLVRWQIYRRVGDPRVLHAPIGGETELMLDPRWTEESFRAWADAYDRVVILEPLDRDALARDRPWELRAIDWMAAHPAFARETVVEIPEGNGRTRRLAFYRRRN